MTHDIDRLLAEACDDHDQPLQHTIDQVVRRGRRRARVRRTGEVTAGAVVAGAVVTGLVSLSPGGDGLPAGGPTGGAPTDSRTTARVPAERPSVPAPGVRQQAAQPPADPVSDAEVRRRCAPQDVEFRRVSENKAGGGNDPIGDWTVVLNHGRDHWFQSILVSGDGKRFAFCQDSSKDAEPYDNYAREAVALTKDYKVYVSDEGSFGPLPDRVARLTFRTPDGTVSDAKVSGGFFVWYTNLRYLDLQGKPVWATFYDASGRQLARFDANPHAPEATFCPGTTPRCSLSTPSTR